MIIRKIQASDNNEIAAIIKDIFIEFGLPLENTSFEDPELACMYENYQENRAVFYVIEESGQVLGGGGIKQLRDSRENICELQKMYFAPKVRGKGFGKLLLDKCIMAAKDLGYEQCYLESASQLKAAIHVYETNGFRHLKGPLGNTGHGSCAVWMLKDLSK